MTLTVRDSTPDDMPEVQQIYALEVLEGTASFETTPPDLDELNRRRDAILALGMPHLVATEGSRVAGYAYASQYRPRPAYRYTLENSVYVASWARRRGVGLLLLRELVQRASMGEWRQMIAVIGGSGHTASIRLHEQAGFEQVGTLKGVGYKFDEWIDSVIMQLEIPRSDPDSR